MKTGRTISVNLFFAWTLVASFFTAIPRTASDEASLPEEQICDATGTCVKKKARASDATSEQDTDPAIKEGAGEFSFDLVGAWFDDRKEEVMDFLNKNIFEEKPDDVDGEGAPSAQYGRGVVKDGNQGQNWSADLEELFGDGAQRSGEQFFNEYTTKQMNDEVTEEQRSWFDDLKELFPKPAPQRTEDGDSADTMASISEIFNSLIKGNSEEAATKLIEDAIEFSYGLNAGEQGRSIMDVFQVVTDAVYQAKESMGRTFGLLHQLEDKARILIAFCYYLEKEDELKNPSWKRRKHRFYQSVNIREIDALHEALYLADLSYADSTAKVRERLGHTRAGWELIYSQLDSEPNKPSHFIALKKDQSVWNDYLDVLLIVRGSKQLGDFLSDALLDAVDYRGGKAHAGITLSGKYLVEKHSVLLDVLLQMSKKKRIKLTLIGHSLGAGAASIAGIEFNDNPNIDATVIGYGCPSLLSKELSESTKSFITSVVADSDIVPRMSGATVSNVVLDMMSYDWADKAMRDVEELLDFLKGNLPIEIPQNLIDSTLSFVNKTIETQIKPAIAKIPLDRVEPILIPPGQCIHFYRDGQTTSGSHTPCDFFSEIDITRTLLDDHLIASGYHRIFLGLMRDYHHDMNFAFFDDISSDNY